MKNIATATIASAFFLAGCSSTPTVNTAESTPLKKGESQYSLSAPVVNLTLGDGAIPNDTTFASQDDLAKQFYQSLESSFAEKKILATGNAKADATVEINMDYQRNFNWGGKALNKPKFSYSVTIKADGKVLASYSVENQTTNYGSFKDAAVNLEISAFKWGAEDEPKDIALIAETIAEEMAEIGE